MAQANLVTETDLYNKLSNLNQIIDSNKTKYLVIENELKKLKAFDSSYFRGKSHFEEDCTENFFVFQPIYSILKQTVIILVLFYHGNLKDWLIKVLRHLLHLINFLIFH